MHAVLQCRGQREPSGAVQCDEMQLLEGEGADLAAAVFAAHPMLVGAQPLGRRLACLPQKLHLAAVRAALRSDAGAGQPTLVLDCTDVQTCRIVAQCCAEGEVPTERLHLHMPHVPPGSAHEVDHAALQSTMSALALGTSLQHLQFDGRHLHMAAHVLARVLRFSTALRNLRSLTVTRCTELLDSDRVMTGLSACLQSARLTLTALVLKDCGTGAEGPLLFSCQNLHTMSSIASMTGLRVLTIAGCNVGGQQPLRQLTALGALRDLDCSNMNRAGKPVHLKVILRTVIMHLLPRMTKLTCLVLSGNPMGPRVWAAIAQSLRNMPQLAQLAMCGCALDAQDVEHIAAGLRDLKHLQTLDLSDNPECGDEGHNAIARDVLHCASALTRLSLRNTGLRAWDSGPVGARLPFLASLRSIGWCTAPADVLQTKNQQQVESIAQIAHLALSQEGDAAAHGDSTPDHDSAMGADSAAPPAQCEDAGGSARQLSITHWELDANPPSLAVIAARSLSDCSTQSFTLMCHPFAEAGCSSEAYWQSLRTSMRLTELQFECGPAAAHAFSEHLVCLTRLQTLSFAKCCLGSTCGAVMAAAMHLTQLTQLDLSHCHLADAELTACAGCVPYIVALRKFVISHNDYTAAGFVTVAQCLPPCRKLRQLLAGNAQHCTLCVGHVALVGEALFECDELTELELPQAECGCAVMHALLPGVMVSIIP